MRGRVSQGHASARKLIILRSLSCPLATPPRLPHVSPVFSASRLVFDVGYPLARYMPAGKSSPEESTYQPINLHLKGCEYM